MKLPVIQFRHLNGTGTSFQSLFIDVLVSLIDREFVAAFRKGREIFESERRVAAAQRLGVS